MLAISVTQARMLVMLIISIKMLVKQLHITITAQTV